MKHWLSASCDFKRNWGLSVGVAIYMFVTPSIRSGSNYFAWCHEESCSSSFAPQSGSWTSRWCRTSTSMRLNGVLKSIQPKFHNTGLPNHIAGLFVYFQMMLRLLVVEICFCLCFCFSNLRLQKRLAASVLKCGRKKIWLDPNETNEIANANSSKWPPCQGKHKPLFVFHHHC